MKKLIEKFILSDAILLEKSISELRELMKLINPDKFNYKSIDRDNYKFFAKISFGTFILNKTAGKIDGISCYGKIKEYNNKSIIVLKTRLRIEVYLFLIASIIFPFIFLYSDENFPVFVYLLFPIIPIWFGFIYRLQEKKLISIIMKFIEREINNK